MTDLLLDSNLLSELLAQYFSSGSRIKGFRVTQKSIFHKDLVRKINSIISWFDDNLSIEEVSPQPGLIIASTFAFVEIARKFNEIVKHQYTVDQMASFINQPPDWFFISSTDKVLLAHLLNLPSEVTLPEGDVVPIEVADSIHVATALSRDQCLMATTDARIREIRLLKNILI